MTVADKNEAGMVKGNDLTIRYEFGNSADRRP